MTSVTLRDMILVCGCRCVALCHGCHGNLQSSKTAPDQACHGCHGRLGKSSVGARSLAVVPVVDGHRFLHDRNDKTRDPGLIQESWPDRGILKSCPRPVPGCGELSGLGVVGDRCRVVIAHLRRLGTVGQADGARPSPGTSGTWCPPWWSPCTAAHRSAAGTHRTCTDHRTDPIDRSTVRRSPIGPWSASQPLDPLEQHRHVLGRGPGLRRDGRQDGAHACSCRRRSARNSRSRRSRPSRSAGAAGP